MHSQLQRLTRWHSSSSSTIRIGSPKLAILGIWLTSFPGYCTCTVLLLSLTPCLVANQTSGGDALAHSSKFHLKLSTISASPCALDMIYIEHMHPTAILDCSIIINITDAAEALTARNISLFADPCIARYRLHEVASKPPYTIALT